MKKEYKKTLSKDKNILTVILSNSARFKFSKKFDEKYLDEKVLRVKTLNSTLPPMLPHYADQLERDVIQRSIHGTAAIEGNPLSEEEVGKILNSATDGELLDDAEQQIKNLELAYKALKSFGKDIKSINIPMLTVSGFHQAITQKLINDGNVPGKLRTNKVLVGDKEHGGIYTPPKIAKDIVSLMNDYIEWLNSPEIKSIDPIYRAVLAHYHFGLIHPFGDGNGRTARLIEAVILRAAGYKYMPEMLSNFYFRNLNNYFIIFRSTERNKQDITPFVDFVLNGIIWSLERIHERSLAMITYLLLKEHYEQARNGNKITQRQHDLLKVLLTKVTDDFKFTAQNLIRDVPFDVLYRSMHKIAANRDIKKLQKMNYLVEEEPNIFILNTELLDQ